MQKDIHFYLTYALALKLGIPGETAERIAWANQRVDEVTEAELHGIQTQTITTGNWGDRQIQFSVHAPFHFLPGDDEVHKWKTTENSKNAQVLVKKAYGKGDFRLGVSMHVMQDTFSHQTFSGWREELNSCYPWYYMVSALPNVGHAEMRVIPDVVHYIWTDPRTDTVIKNWERALRCSKATIKVLAKHPDAANAVQATQIWNDSKTLLKEIFTTKKYDDRKQKLADFAGNAGIRYKKVAQKLEKQYEKEFVEAATTHLAEAIQLFAGLPRVLDQLTMQVIPNQFTQSVQIRTEGSRQTPTISIVSSSGVVVKEVKEAGYEWVPDNTIQPGSYLVQATTDEATVIRRVVYLRNL